AVAYDVRHGSAEFALETAKIFAANGFEVYIFTGMRPTPLLSFAVRYKQCCGGVMVTASHNPKEYNGYKAYGADGGQLVSPHDKAVIAEVRKITSYELVKREGGDGLIHYVDAEIEEAYMQALDGLRSPEVAASAREAVKIVYTPLHGTGMTMVPKALRAWGFEQVIAVPEQMWPDGDFPYAASPNPEEQAAMSAGMALAAKLQADVVMATDPDADRIGLGVPDGQGGYRLLNGNQTAALVTDYLLRRAKGKPNPYVVKTIVTTEMLKDMAEAQGVRCYDVLTGFKYIAEVLAVEEGKGFFVGGGEESYGYLAADFVRDKDAVMTACVIAEMVASAVAEGKGVMQLLEETYSRYGLYAQALVSLTKKGRSGTEEIQRMMADFRANPPKRLGEETVCETRDYAQ
ncbi:MAG: phospho-sugar mutase, partial [Bacteroidales bacterium]|nr:phospho-sugar mutase [Bacteroidales bacterium]